MPPEPSRQYESSSRYFENRACQYYPCHAAEHINCLFCFCPFYLRADCPGAPRFKQKGSRRVKDCSGCTFPHQQENYEKIIKLLKENIKNNIWCF